MLNIEDFEIAQQILQLRIKILQVEEERINGAETLNMIEARTKLKESLQVNRKVTQ